MTTTTTPIRRGTLVPLPDGQIARVLSIRSGYIITDRGTFDQHQLDQAAAAADPIAAARSFLDTQSAAMREWSGGALPNRREHEIALGHIAALLKLMEEQS